MALTVGDREAAARTVLEVVRRELVAPLAEDPNVRMIEIHAVAGGWQVRVLVDRWTLESTRPVAEQFGRVHEALHREAPDALLEGVVWEWVDEDAGARDPQSRILYRREAA